MNHEQREKVFETASDIQKKLYESHESGLALEQIGVSHSLENHIDFAIAVGDVILGLVPQEKLPELLVERLGIERAAAMRITADVLDFLAPLDQPEPVKTSATAVPINADANPEPINDNSLASEIAEAEATMQALEPIKTMSHDMEVVRSKTTDEPVHSTASQADLLDHAAAVKEKNPDSRWNTEQS